MIRIFITLFHVVVSSVGTAQIPVYGTFKDSVYAVASDSLNNEVFILGAQIATGLNNIELKSPKGKEVMSKIYKEMDNQKTCEEVFHLCQFDLMYLTHAYRLCKMIELSKIVITNYPYSSHPRYSKAISKEHTRLHPEVNQMYIDSHSRFKDIIGNNSRND